MFGLTPLRRTYAAAVRDLSSPRPEVRASAAHDLGLVGDASPREAADTLAPLLGEPHAAVRGAVLQALAILAARHLVDAMAARLEDPDSEVRQVAAMAIAEVGGDRALAHLRAAMRHTHPEVRFQALLGIIEMDPGEGLGVAIAALESDDPWIASEAATQIGDLLGPDRSCGMNPSRQRRPGVEACVRAVAVEALAALLDSPQDRVVVTAAIALGRAGDPRAVPALSHFVLGRRAVAGDDVADLLRDAMDALAAAPKEVAGEARAALESMASRVLPTVRRRLARETLAALDARTSSAGAHGRGQS